jgi:hypothetical protein
MGVFLTDEEDEKYGSRINIDTDGEIRDTGNDLSDKIKKAVEARLEEEKKNYPDMADDLVIADPEMENPTGMFSAWLISEKKMSPDAAFKVLKDSENYEALADEYAKFIADSSVLADDFHNTVISAKPGAIAKILKDANEALENYKIPVFDVYDLKQGRDAVVSVKGASRLAQEIANHTKRIDQSPYKFKAIHSTLDDKYMDYELSKGETSALNTFCGEIIPDNKKKDKIEEIKKVQEKKSRQAYELNSIFQDIYDPGFSYSPLRLLVAREKIKDFMGKTITEADPDNTKFDDEIRKRANDISETTAMKNVSEARMLDRLLGNKDDEIDEIVSAKGAVKISITKNKIKSQKQITKETNKAVEKSDTGKSIRDMKDRQVKSSDHDFKLRAEIYGEDVQKEIYKVDQNNKHYDNLKKIADAINVINLNIKVLNTTVKYNFQDFEVDGVKPSFIFGNNVNGRYEAEDYYEQLVNNNNSIKVAIDAIKADEDYDKLPQNIKDIVAVSENIYRFDNHFYDWIEEMPLHLTSVDEAKKKYTNVYGFVKSDGKKIEEQINTAKNTQGNTYNISVLKNIIDENDAVKNIDVDNHKEIFNNADLVGGLNDDKVNVKNYIEELQNGIDSRNNMTFDDFAKLLALRTIADAKRNSFRGNSLNKDVDRNELNNMIEEFKNEPSVKTAFQYAKVNPKRWESLNKAFKTGHGGGIEDYYKTTLKVANFEDIPQSDTFARFRPTVKEKIEFMQDLVKNGSERLTSAVTDIIVCRNIAGAERDKKGKLDFVMSGDFIKKAVEQEKILKEHKAFNSMVREINRKQLKDLITTGHGGAMSELVRQASEQAFMRGEKEVHSVLWHNTVDGMIDRINAQFAEIKNDVKDIAENLPAVGEDEVDELKRQNALVFDDDDNIIPTVEELKPDVNISMKRNVARAVVVSKMKKEKKNASRNEYASDFSDSDFIKRVDKLMDDPEFGTVYAQMMKVENQVDPMTVENVNNKYHEVRQQLGLEAKPKAKQNEPEKQVENKAPAMN